MNKTQPLIPGILNCREKQELCPKPDKAAHWESWLQLPLSHLSEEGDALYN